MDVDEASKSLYLYWSFNFQIRSGTFEFPVWYTGSVTKMIKEMNTIRRNLFQILFSLRFALQLQMKLDYLLYVQSIESYIFDDPKRVWRYVRVRRNIFRIHTSIVSNNKTFTDPLDIVLIYVCLICPIVLLIVEVRT